MTSKLRLDTLHKKPKAYSLLLLAAVTTAIQLPLLLLGGERELPLSSLLFSLAFLAATALLLRAFLRQLRYNLYSYNTIIYFGFALFTLFISVIFLHLFFTVRNLPVEAIRATTVSRLLGSAKTYTLFTLPFLLVFSTALVISNLSLIRHEGFRPVNVLGIVLAVLLLGGNVLIFALNYAVSGSQAEVMRHDLFTNLLAAIYLYFECMLFGTILADAIAARYEPEKDKDCLVILGCGIRKDGTPTPLLRGRMERALAFAEAQQAQTGKAPILVLSGGQGADECVSEAECMRRWLVERGVPEERLRLEDRSADTAENMRFSRELILREKPEAKVAYATTNYHVFRAGVCARRVGLRAQGMGCRSKWYFWPNAAVREFVGLLVRHRGKQLLILLSLLVCYAVLTVINYSF